MLRFFNCSAGWRIVLASLCGLALASPSHAPAQECGTNEYCVCPVISYCGGWHVYPCKCVETATGKACDLWQATISGPWGDEACEVGHCAALDLCPCAVERVCLDRDWEPFGSNCLVDSHCIEDDIFDYLYQTCWGDLGPECIWVEP